MVSTWAGDCLLTMLRALVLRPDSWTSAAVMLMTLRPGVCWIRAYNNPALIYSGLSLTTTQRRVMTTIRPCRWRRRTPPTQQQCPQGYYRTSTGQCLPIPKCTTPGTVFDQARGTCVPKGQAVSPLPGEAEDFFANLKNIPWWVWLALGGAFLLSRDDGGKKTTVTYRRAR